MRLRGRQGTVLDLSIVDYEHPDETVDPWDSNSLLVAVRVVTPHGAWEVVDPCLTTWEADRLVRWLAAVARGADVAAGRPVGLHEPNLALVAEGSAARVAVTACFSLERRPPWARTAAGSGRLCVELDVDRADVGSAAAALAGDLARFPQRGDDPTL